MPGPGTTGMRQILSTEEIYFPVSEIRPLSVRSRSWPLASTGQHARRWPHALSRHLRDAPVAPEFLLARYRESPQLIQFRPQRSGPWFQEPVSDGTQLLFALTDRSHNALRLPPWR